MRKAILPFAYLLLAAPVVAVAQECNINESSPNQVARAMIALQQASGTQAPDQAARRLADAVKLLTENPDRLRGNQVGASFVLGKAVVLWMQQPGVGYDATRARVGYVGADAPIDLVAVADSLFDIVEASNAACASETAQWRMQQPWANLINAAIQALNGDLRDSAEVLANRSIRLYAAAPYPYLVLASVAQGRGQINDAIRHWKRTVELSGSDTSYTDTKHQTLIQLAAAATEAADTTTNAAAKAALLNEAKLAFEALLADNPNVNYADQARSGLGRLALARGDTAAFRATYADQLANPGRYDYASLMQAAVSAARGEQSADATRLFEAALAKNPHHRDVLYNLGLMYIRADQHAKGLDIVRRLLVVDPMNDDNLRLAAFAWAGMQKEYNAQARAAERAAATTAAARTARAARVRAYTDSASAATTEALKYQEMIERLPVKVTFTDFSPSDTGAVLQGTLLNKTDAAKSYTVTFEFTDVNGQVVGSQTVTVANVAAGRAGQFRAQVAGRNITAFRYAKVD